MRFLYLATLILFLHTSLSAQIEIAPLTSNPVIKAHQSKMGKTRPDDSFLGRMMTNNCPDPTQVDTTFGESSTVYVVSGESVLICIDQLAFTILDSAQCLNCDDLLFGNVSYNPDNYCFTYTADAGLIAETGDVMVIEVTDLNGQEELEFSMVVKRTNNTITQPLSTLSTEGTIALCINSIDLPGTDFDFSFKGCSNPLYGQLTTPDNCVDYTAKRFAEPDEVCIEVCDEFCVCDTYIFPIQINGDTLQLPFFDDFSNAGPFPDKNLWLDDNVYVNNHFPFQPLSYGVATFDGLDQFGSPYGGNGAADYLTSGYIDLDGLDQSDNVYMSYYIQPKGLSNFFPGILDSLVLQFRTDTSGWESIESYDGLLGSTSPFAKVAFSPDSIKTHHIRSPRFLHERFQFRFINHCRRLGMQYLWHIDYVRINKDEIPLGPFTDVAFTELPNSLLKEYRHMPIEHFTGFEAQELNNAREINIYNSNTSKANALPSSLIISNCDTREELLLAALLFGEPQLQDTISPQQHILYENSYDFSALANTLSQNSDPITLETAYTFEISDNNSQDTTLYPTTARNDTVRAKTILSDFFAYDDGSPEALVWGDEEGLQLATQFHANIADSLTGVQFNFPHTGNNLNADFVIKVWLDELDNDETPIYTSPALSVIYPDLFFDTLNGLTTYRFQTAELEDIKVAIPAGTFFVGIEQVSSGKMGLGFDLNSPDAVNFQLFKGTGFNAQWDTLIQDGAMMVRPMVGSEFPLFTETQEPRVEPATLAVKLYPNPAQDILYLPVNQDQTNDLEMQVVSSTGQILLAQPWQSRLNLNNWTNGLYFIQIIDQKTGAQVKEKFLILR